MTAGIDSGVDDPLVAMPTNLLDKIYDGRVAILLWSLIAAGLLFIASFMLGVSSVEFKGSLTGFGQVSFHCDPDAHAQWANRKQVGFAYALNWGLYSLVLVPLMIWLMIHTWWNMRQSILRAAEGGLLRNPDLTVIGSQEVLALWRRTLRTFRLPMLVIAVVVAGAFMADFLKTVGRPLFNPSILAGKNLCDPVYEFDWSIASTFADVPRIPLAIFDFIAYAYVGAFIGAAGYVTCFAALIFTLFACGQVTGRPVGWEIAALPMSARDNRMGFDVFSGFFANFFGLVGVILIACLLMMIQNSYLRSTTAGDIWTFLGLDFSKVWTGFSELMDIKPKDWSPLKWIDWFLYPAKVSWQNPDVCVGALSFACAAIVTCGASWTLLHIRARRARQFTRDNIADLAASIRVSEPELGLRIDKMEIWPVGWATERQLFAAAICLTLAIGSYRAMFLPLAFLATQGVGRVWNWVADKAQSKSKQHRPSPRTRARVVRRRSR